MSGGMNWGNAGNVGPQWGDRNEYKGNVTNHTYNISGSYQASGSNVPNSSPNEPPNQSPNPPSGGSTNPPARRSVQDRTLAEISSLGQTLHRLTNAETPRKEMKAILVKFEEALIKGSRESFPSENRYVDFWVNQGMRPNDKVWGEAVGEVGRLMGLVKLNLQLIGRGVSKDEILFGGFESTMLWECE